MPCYDSRNEPSYLAKEFRHNSDVAQMLCHILKNYPEAACTAEIQEWWKEHKKRDNDPRN